MSTPTYFFAATPYDASTVRCRDDLTDRHFVRAKNITPAIIGNLDFALTGARTREPVDRSPDENSALFQFDDELVSALASVEDEKLEEIADESGLYDPSLVAELRDLARGALSRGETVFLFF
jgi:hypothetical protein